MMRALVVSITVLLCSFLAAATVSLRASAGEGEFSAAAATTTATGSSSAMNFRTPRVLRVDDFVPLSCNNKTDDTTDCLPWSQVFGTTPVHTERLVIPCGTCVTMDVPVLKLQDGLDIHGTLRVVDVPLVLETTVLVVQGVFEMTAAAKAVDGNPQIHITMIGDREDDGMFEPVHDNAKVCGGDDCAAGKKAIVVAGGQININGLPMYTPIWVPLHDVAGASKEEPDFLIVSDDVRDSWAPGAEILITSHTHQWDGHQVRRIVSVTTLLTALGYVWIELDAPIQRPTTSKEHPEFAVHVALLSRHIVFEGGKDETNSHGGHLWIRHTPTVVQRLRGVDIRNFGQQGTLGRYPIHFHLCSDVSGSIVAKNTIRQSNQRCIVVHGTDNVLVEENIAYSTAGHCFIVEDGIERGNSFIRNLGAETTVPAKGVPGASDRNNPAIFWITNPLNIFEGNIAAGSEGSGFWFELGVRGEREHLYLGGDPKREPLLLFKDNTAHSCLERGVTTYPSGFLPDQVAELQGLKSYLNSGSGLFLHITKNIKIAQGIFANNDGIAIDIDRADAVTIVNTTIIGVGTDDSNPCSQKATSVIGVELHSWKDDPYEEGIVLDNVSFTGFSNVQQCKYAYPIAIDDTIKTPTFDLYTTIRRVTVEEAATPLDFCRADDQGIHDIYLSASDGSLGPQRGTSANGTSTIISNQMAMLRFVDVEKCTENAIGCYQYCEDTCFRSVRYEVDPAAPVPRLKVCKSDDPSVCHFISGYQRTNDITWSTRDRVYRAHLPVGSYTAVFVHGSGALTWPAFVVEHVEEHSCPLENGHSIDLFVPQPEPQACSSLLRNGDMETSAFFPLPLHWLSRFGEVQFAKGKGTNGSNALVGVAEDDDRVMIVQFLDSRCLKLMRGETFAFSAHVKVESANGPRVECDPERRRYDCPIAGIFTSLDGYNVLAKVAPSDPQVDGFFFLEATFVISESMVESDKVFFYIQQAASQSTQLLVDNVSMSLLQDEPIMSPSIDTSANTPKPTLSFLKSGSVCTNLIRNSDFELGVDGFWEKAGFFDVLVAETKIVFSGDSGGAMLYRNGLFSGKGPTYRSDQYIQPFLQCMKAGTKWVVEARMKLLVRFFGIGATCLSFFNCPSVYITIKGPADGLVLETTMRYTESLLWNTNTESHFGSTFSLPTSWGGQIDSVSIGIRYWDLFSDLIVDDFTIRPVNETI